MATITHMVTTPDTGNLPNTSGAFVPSAGDLLIVFVTVEGNIGNKVLTSSVSSITFTQFANQNFRSGVDALLGFVSDHLITPVEATSQTVTIPASGSGSIISAYTVAGGRVASLNAIHQHGGTNNQVAGIPPSSSWAAADAANACLSAVANATNPAGITNAPTGWTKSQDTGYTTGAVTGLATAFRNSGETSNFIQWGTNSATINANIIVEIDQTAEAIKMHPAQRPGVQTLVAT
jgi:hypothetical protein